MQLYEEEDSDRYEHEVEYDRLLQGLTGKGAEEFVTKLHAGHSGIGGMSKLAHLHVVSDQASKLAFRFFDEADFNEQTYKTKVCRYAGMLHEAMRVGGSFEDLVEVGDENVARAVAALTPDNRLPYPSRRRALLNQVGRADAVVQLIQFADLHDDCAQLVKLSPKALKGDVLARVDQWRADAHDMFNVLFKLKDSYTLTPYFHTFKANLQQVGQNCLIKAKRA